MTTEIERETTIVILLPARNEEQGLGQVIDEIRALPLEPAPHIIVAENGSTDNTVAVAEAKGAEVISCPTPGKGTGVRYALERIRGRFDYLFMLDADFTYPAGNILPMLELLRNGADVVMSHRKHRQPGSMTKLHRFGNRVISTWAGLLYRRRVNDCLSGMWGFYAPYIEKLQLGATDFRLEADMFSGAAGAGLTICEVTIGYRPRKGESKLRWKDGLWIMWHLLKRRFTYRRGG